VAAYAIAVVSETHDADALAEYRRRNTDAVAAHGGRFLVRGGPVEALEGAWEPLRVVVMEFPDRAAARAWYESDDYQAIAPIRQGASTTDIILVDGAG
jgi:uncharacterized protein (DUF1330 family)